MLNYRKYITNTESDKRWDLYINTVGSATVQPNQSYPNNRAHPADHVLNWDKGRILNGYYLVFISRGKGILEMEHKNTTPVSAGTCFFLFPGIWHRYRPEAKYGWEEYWVGFNGNYSANLVKNGVFGPDNAIIDVGLNEGLLTLFHTLIKITTIAEPGYQQIAIGVTLQILGLVVTASKYQQPSVSLESRLISKAKFILQETIDNPLNLEEMVKELPMSYSKFRKTFKDLCGISPKQYHLNLRLDKAKDLLLSTNLTINQIADQTGFESIFYFSRRFKSKNGVSPKLFRDKIFSDH
jgi:AraC-like DNA-binding protein